MRVSASRGWMAALALALTSLSGCETSPGFGGAFGRAEPEPEAETSADEAAGAGGPTEGVEIGTLSAQELRPGECGLFLWTKTRPPQLVFFSPASDRPARMVIDAREVKLTRRSVEGAEFYRHFETEAYESEDRSLSVRLTVQKGAEMVDGALVPQGAMRVRKTDGWEVVAPVGGMVACEY